MSKDISNFFLQVPVTDSEWANYHKIRKESIFDPINVIYDYNHASLTDCDNYHFAFYCNNKLIGALHIHDLKDLKCAIRTIAIEKSERNNGYGSVLLKLAEEKAILLGASIIHLHANPEAINFYLKNYYSRMEFPNDICVYSKAVDFGKHL